MVQQIKSSYPEIRISTYLQEQNKYLIGYPMSSYLSEVIAKLQVNT